MYVSLKTMLQVLFLLLSLSLALALIMQYKCWRDYSAVILVNSLTRISGIDESVREPSTRPVSEAKRASLPSVC
jgi:hypothetical protein